MLRLSFYFYWIFFIPRNLPEISHNHNHSSSIKEASLFSSFFPLICSVGSQQKFRPHVKVKVSLVPVSQRLTSLSENLIFCLQLKCFSQSPSDSMASTPLTRDTINPKVRFFCCLLLNRDLGLLWNCDLIPGLNVSFYLCCWNGASGFSCSALFTVIVSCITWSSFICLNIWPLRWINLLQLNAEKKGFFILFYFTIHLFICILELWCWVLGGCVWDWWFGHSVFPCCILVFPSRWICDFNIFPAANNLL